MFLLARRNLFHDRVRLAVTLTGIVFAVVLIVVQIGLFILVVFVNLFALFYGLARLIFLKDTGVKLHHLDRQLTTRDTVLADLTLRIEE